MKGSQQSSSSTSSQLSKVGGGPPTPNSGIFQSSFASRSKTSVQKQESVSVGKRLQKKAIVNSSSSSQEAYVAVPEEEDDDEIMSSSRSKHASRSRSRSNQSNRMHGGGELTKNIKKRRYQEISQFEPPEEIKGVDRKDMLWVDKYAPKCLVSFCSVKICIQDDMIV